MGLFYMFHPSSNHGQLCHSDVWMLCPGRDTIEMEWILNLLFEIDFISPFIFDNSHCPFVQCFVCLLAAPSSAPSSLPSPLIGLSHKVRCSSVPALFSR